MNSKIFFLLWLGVVLTSWAGELSSDEVKTALRVFGDTTKSIPARIEAANFLLKGDGVVDSRLSKQISAFSLKLIEQPEYQTQVLSRVVRYLKDDSATQAAMLKALKPSTDKDALLYTLGKVRCKSAIHPIKDLLSSSESKSFSRTRAYLTIGEIGGKEAFDSLIPFLRNERDVARKNMIIEALGLTRDVRSKTVLLSILREEKATTYAAALEGLRLLGDASVVPNLRAELSKSSSEGRNGLIRHTIEAIERGDSNPGW